MREIEGTPEGAARLVEAFAHARAEVLDLVPAVARGERFKTKEIDQRLANDRMAKANLLDHVHRLERRLAAAEAELKAARAVLAPLLDDPYEEQCAAATSWNWSECRFCRVERKYVEENWDASTRRYLSGRDATEHKLDCPVLRKDDLLGRAGGGATDGRGG